MKGTLNWPTTKSVSDKPKKVLVRSTFSFADPSITPIFAIGSLYRVQNSSGVNPTSKTFAFRLEISLRPKLRI